ncbi:MAG TPA: aspartate/glutamate racemase family protein [Clostridia bacterium]|nr:aspartate/glutamate racemase family protein [Clostridia bacterium]
MKILIINPNSSEDMTKSIQETALQYANGDFEVKTFSTPGAPEYIDYYSDAAQAAPGMMRLVKENEAEYDAFIVACHCDPNLDLLKQITDKPVVGIGESSMKLASMLGHSFSVVSAGDHSIPNKYAVIRKYHLEGCTASVRGPKEPCECFTASAPYLSAARTAIEEDLAEVIVLGCAGFSGLAPKMQKELGVPVLDGVVCALIVASGLVKAGLSTSKIRRYRDVEK